MNKIFTLAVALLAFAQVIANNELDTKNLEIITEQETVEVVEAAITQSEAIVAATVEQADELIIKQKQISSI